MKGVETMAIESLKELTPVFMKEYIDKNEPGFKDEFKKVALVVNKNGEERFNSAAARQEFCKHFEEFAHLLPKKKEKKLTATKLYQDW